VFTEVRDEALEQPQDNEKDEKTGDDKFESLFEVARRHDGADFRKQPEKAHAQDEGDKEDREVQKESRQPVERNQGAEDSQSLWPAAENPESFDRFRSLCMSLRFSVHAEALEAFRIVFQKSGREYPRIPREAFKGGFS
jgi:hypothetical protein